MLAEAIELQPLSAVKLLDFYQSFDDKAVLTVFPGEQDVPFSIKRVFTINNRDACQRGEHAHYKCKQLLVCLTGVCTVVCTDSVIESRFNLSSPKVGLLIPETIWAKQLYNENSCLMVLTDRKYEPEDYIRDYQEFVKIRNQGIFSI